MTESLLNIRKAIKSDVDQIVSVHRKVFSGFYLDRMGSAFLKIYYECALANSGVISFIATDKSGVIVGFVLGFKFPKSFYKEFKSAKSKLFLPITIAILRSPSLLIPTISNILKVDKNSTTDNNDSYTELVSIGVLPNSKGIGSQLLTKFIHIADLSDSKEIRLTTNRDDNHKANQFYLKHGFENKGIEYQHKRVLNKYSLYRLNTHLIEKK